MLVTTTIETFSTIQLEQVEYQVVHQNARRIRLVIPHLAVNQAYARHLKYLVALECVTQVRINPVASSIAVEYDYEAL